MNALFSPKALLSYAPDFILARFPSVVMGIIVGYVFMLTFFGSGAYDEAPKSFLSRLMWVGITVAICQASARLLRYGLQSTSAYFNAKALQEASKTKESNRKEETAPVGGSGKSLD